MKHEVKCSSRTSCGPEALLSVLKLPPLEGGGGPTYIALSLALRCCCPTHMALAEGPYFPLPSLPVFLSTRDSTEKRGFL